MTLRGRALNGRARQSGDPSVSQGRAHAAAGAGGGDLRGGGGVAAGLNPFAAYYQSAAAGQEWRECYSGLRHPAALRAMKTDLGCRRTPQSVGELSLRRRRSGPGSRTTPEPATGSPVLRNLSGASMRSYRTACSPLVSATPIRSKPHSPRAFHLATTLRLGRASPPRRRRGQSQQRRRSRAILPARSTSIEGRGRISRLNGSNARNAARGSSGRFRK